MLGLALAAVLAADGAQPVVYVTGDGGCPEPGVEWAYQTHDGGPWYVPAPRMAALECRLVACEEALVGADAGSAMPGWLWLALAATAGVATGLGLAWLLYGPPRPP